jgi:hypothetical protein
MMASRFGALIAAAMSAVARVLGVVIYYLLRAIYRPKDRAVALTGIGLIILAAVIYWTAT